MTHIAFAWIHINPKYRWVHFKLYLFISKLGCSDPCIVYLVSAVMFSSKSVSILFLLWDTFYYTNHIYGAIILFCNFEIIFRWYQNKIFRLKVVLSVKYCFVKWNLFFSEYSYYLIFQEKAHFRNFEYFSFLCLDIWIILRELNVMWKVSSFWMEEELGWTLSHSLKIYFWNSSAEWKLVYDKNWAKLTIYL